MIRIDKYLSDNGICLRSKAKAFLKEHEILVNNVRVTDASMKIDETSLLLIDNQPILYEEYHYYILNKPAGFTTSTSNHDGICVMELLKDINCKNLFPVGRLDKDTTGLLLFTDDGAYAHELLSPKHHVEKTYIASVDKMLTKEQIDILLGGIMMDGEKAMAKSIKALDELMYEVILQEGKYHEVKRLFRHFGVNVVKLERIKFGPYELGDLEIGKFIKVDKIS